MMTMPVADSPEGSAKTVDWLESSTIVTADSLTEGDDGGVMSFLSALQCGRDRGRRRVPLQLHAYPQLP